MDNSLPLTDDLIAELEGMSIRTSQGSFIRMEDARRLIEKKKASQQVDDALPVPKNMDEARRMAKDHLEKIKFGAQGPQEPGRAVPATEPQPPSRA